MTAFDAWRRAAATLLALGLAAIVLSACMLTSETNLVSPDEADSEVLPASFTFHPYNEADGVFTPAAAEDGPGTFTLRDGGYVAPDESLTAYFLPSPDEGDYYMLALAAKDGAMYGIARIDGRGIMELRVVFDGGLADQAGLLPPGATLADGGIAIATRADLDTIVALIANGSLPTSPLVAYAGTGTPPPKILPDGEWYRME